MCSRVWGNMKDEGPTSLPCFRSKAIRWKVLRAKESRERGSGFRWPGSDQPVATSSALAFSTTCPAVNPRFSNTTSYGAEAPNRSRPMTSPRGPTYRSQPSLTPGSMARRAGTDDGRTESRYSSDWASNSSQLGMLTTRAAIPSSASASRASRARYTSEPDAMRITSG